MLNKTINVQIGRQEAAPCVKPKLRGDARAKWGGAHFVDGVGEQQLDSCHTCCWAAWHMEAEVIKSVLMDNQDYTWR